MERNLNSKRFIPEGTLEFEFVRWICTKNGPINHGRFRHPCGSQGLRTIVSDPQTGGWQSKASTHARKKLISSSKLRFSPLHHLLGAAGGRGPGQSPGGVPTRMPEEPNHAATPAMAINATAYVQRRRFRVLILIRRSQTIQKVRLVRSAVSTCQLQRTKVVLPSDFIFSAYTLHDPCSFLHCATISMWRIYNSVGHKNLSTLWPLLQMLQPTPPGSGSVATHATHAEYLLATLIPPCSSAAAIRIWLSMTPS